MDGDLLSIEVDADDYAETAAQDTPSTTPRTFQSEADFQKQKSAYTAKVDDGNLYAELLRMNPCLRSDRSNSTTTSGGSRCEKTKLGKRDVQLLGYTTGEMYYHKDFEGVIALCGLVEERCEVDGKLEGSLKRWREKCTAKVNGTEGQE